MLFFWHTMCKNHCFFAWIRRRLWTFSEIGSSFSPSKAVCRFHSETLLCTAFYHFYKYMHWQIYVTGIEMRQITATRCWFLFEMRHLDLLMRVNFGCLILNLLFEGNHGTSWSFPCFVCWQLSSVCISLSEMVADVVSQEIWILQFLHLRDQ